MAFFGSSKNKESYTPLQTKDRKIETVTQNKSNENEYIKIPTHDISILKHKVNVKGSIDGGGSLIIGGNFEGDINVEKTIFVEKDAKVNATIRANEVKISGNFEGNIYANLVEVTSNGTFKGTINSNKTFLGGNIDGIINSVASVVITESGKLNTKRCRSKMIKIVGSVNGKVIASELLEITNGGKVEGTIITKGIKTEQGGSVIGNIQTYNPSEHEDGENDPTKLLDIHPNDMQKYAKKSQENN